MRKTRLWLMTIAALLGSLTASAHDFEVDGIYYNVTSETDLTVEVTYQGNSFSDNNEYPGTVIIPSTVSYDSKTYSVTSIGYDAFRRCVLTSVTLPESVTSIESYTFYQCGSLTSITIPENSQLTSIGDRAFGFCSSLASITIPEGVTSIGEATFYGCSSLTSITIPEGVTSIGGSAFSHCSSLKSITLPEGVTSIGGSAFSYCSSLKSIALPESVTSIESYTFYQCGSLTSITIPENSQLTSIGDCAFGFCSSLTAISIPEGVTSIENEAFFDCGSLTSIVVAESNTVYNSRNGCNAIIETSSKTLILGCSSTIIPEGVQNIGKQAFYGCKGLTSITIPNSVVNIKESAFSWCSDLTSITIPYSVRSIGDKAFYGCSILYKVLNYSDLNIQKRSNSNGHVACYAQKVVNVDGVIGDYLFTIKDGVYCLSDYIGKETILTLPEDYDGDDYEIYEEAFAYNDSMVSVAIPQTVGVVGKSAFAGCGRLREVTLARGVMSIEDNAFENCTSLASIVTPQSMSTIGNSAFAGCTSLASVTFKRGVETIGNNAFENCTSLTSLFFPESLETIGEKAFSGCGGLTDLCLSENIEAYGEGAFEGCTEVETLMVMGSVMPTVPSDKLTSITLFSPRPLETEPFANKVYRNATLYVPEGSLSCYQSADVWEDFWTIEEFDPTGIEDVTVDEDADAPIYTMKGMRVNGSRSTLPAGLYIQNGKKFVVM